MTEIEETIVEKILEKIDIDSLTDKIAEKLAKKIMGIEKDDSTPDNPIPKVPDIPWINPIRPSRPYEPIVVMYGCTPMIDFNTISSNQIKQAFDESNSSSNDK